MNRNTLFSMLLFGLLSNTALSQITVVRSDFGSFGDKVLYAHDTTVSSIISPGAAGPNQTWDFSDSVVKISANYYDTAIFGDVTTNPLAPAGSNMSVIEGKDTQYLAITTNDAKTIVPLGPPVGGVFVVKVMKFPSTYLSEIIDSSMRLVAGKPADFGFPPVLDSIIIVAKININVKSDAWGNLTTPGGTFNTIRNKNTVVTNFVIFGKSLLNGQWSVIQQQAQIDISYNWLANSQKDAVAEAKMDSLGHIKEFKYKLNSIPPPAGLENISAAGISFQVFPNPVNEVLHLAIEAKVSSDLDIKVFDISGRMVKSSDYFMKTTSAETSIDLRELNSGIYFCRITGQDFSVSKKIIINK